VPLTAYVPASEAVMLRGRLPEADLAKLKLHAACSADLQSFRCYNVG
jgi:hypothetical protein